MHTYYDLCTIINRDLDFPPCSVFTCDLYYSYSVQNGMDNISLNDMILWFCSVHYFTLCTFFPGHYIKVLLQGIFRDLRKVFV